MPRPIGRLTRQAAALEGKPVPDTYDVIVIGAGPTGENVADRAVKGGLTAAIVESELVGGECSYWACIPSKALLRPVAAVAEAGHVEGVTGARLTPPAVLDRRDSFTSHWRDDGQVSWLDGAHIDLFRGHGRRTGPRSVSVGSGQLQARHAVVICTGSTAVIPPVPGLAEARPWCRAGSPSSAAGWWDARWPPPGRRSAPRSPCSPGAAGCCPGWRNSPATWWPTG